MAWMMPAAIAGSALLSYFGQKDANRTQLQAVNTQARYQYMQFTEGLDLRRDAMNQQFDALKMQLMFQERSDKRDYRLSLRALESDANIRLKEIEYGHEENMTALRNDARALEIERLEAGNISTDDLGLFA